LHAASPSATSAAARQAAATRKCFGRAAGPALCTMPSPWDPRTVGGARPPVNGIAAMPSVVVLSLAGSVLDVADVDAEVLAAD